MSEHPATTRLTAMRTRPPRLFGIVARWALVPPLSRDDAARVVRMADERYKRPPALARTPGGRFDIRMASYLVALRDALVKSGMPAERAGGLLADAMYRVMRPLQRSLDVVAATVHPKDAFARTAFRERLARQAFYQPPDWVMTDVDVPGCYAFEVHRCLYADYLRGREEGPFCERVLCAQDHRMAEGRGQPLLRTGTLAGGADRCDFRYVVNPRIDSESVRPSDGRDRAGVR